MRTTLQYAYSISVLVGVLVTTYFFMNREENIRIYMQQNSNYVIQGDMSDPAVNQLLEFQIALKNASAKKDSRELSNQINKNREKKIRD